MDAGATIAGVVSTNRPICEVGPPLPEEQLVLVGESDLSPRELPASPRTPEYDRIGESVAALIPPGARLQIGPGLLGAAVVGAIREPIRIETGMLIDEVVDLDERGLLIGDPTATYLAGGERLYNWADGRSILHRLEYTHDITRLSSGDPFVAVNTAIEIDEQGQVNVEGFPGSTVGGVGGHPDYAVAAARSVGGLSVMALPSQHRGKPTLVERLSAPTSTPAHDVDVVVTELGTADLRGLDRGERRAAVRAIF